MGHELCVATMRADAERCRAQLASMTPEIEDLTARLDALDPDSEATREQAKQLAFSIRNRIGKDYECRPPEITFRDRMTLDCGDLTLELIYFGRAHSGSDILIRIPEEGLLLTGDLFLDRGWLPLFAGLRTLDVPRFIEVLGEVLDQDDRVRTVIPGHRDLWPREKLVLWRDYIVEVWGAVNTAHEEGLNPLHVISRLPLAERYRYPMKLGHTKERLEQFHQNTIRAFWRQLQESAADKVEAALAEGGKEAAMKAFAEMKDRRGEVQFDETDFNALGYRLMQQGNLKGAIVIFELNAGAFPGSWNVHDSLGEALLNAGRLDRAAKCYEKSLELNPDNVNGKRMLERIAAER